MQKRASIVPGDSVGWAVKVHPRLDYECAIDAKVKAVEGDIATIEIRKNNTCSAQIVEFTVPLSDLENKRWIRDDEKFWDHERDRFSKAEIINSADWQGGFEEFDGDKVFYSVDDYLEECEDNGNEPHEYLWCVNFVEPQKIEADYFEESLIEQVEDYEPKGLEELQSAIDAFYAQNPVKLYETNYTKAVWIAN